MLRKAIFPTACSDVRLHTNASTWSWRYTSDDQRRLYEAAKNIQGWSGEMTFDALLIVGEAQRRLNVRGVSVGELGVHQGKSFMWVEATSASHERVFALDIFDMQQFNTDHSGGAKLTVDSFWQNIGPPIDTTSPSDRKHIHVMRESSRNVDACRFDDDALTPVRMFSIDGSHTGDMTYADMKLAASVLSIGGCMFVDDYLNPGWLGVVEGVHRFLYEERDRWAPLAIIAGKFWICDADYVERYRRSLETELPSAAKARSTELGRTMKVTSSSLMYDVRVIFLEGS